LTSLWETRRIIRSSGIAEIFLQAARRALKPRGRVVMVTRKPEWFDARMRQFFTDIDVKEARKYYVVSGLQRESSDE